METPIPTVKHHVKRSLAFARLCLRHRAVQEPTPQMDAQSATIKPPTRGIDSVTESLLVILTHLDSLICTSLLPKSTQRVSASFPATVRTFLDMRSSQNFSHRLSRLGLPLEASILATLVLRATHGKTLDDLFSMFLHSLGVIYARPRAIERPSSPL